jgi:hypothetical protein
MELTERYLDNKEIIISIEEHNERPNERMSGFAITTTKQVIKLLIDDEQDCCETFGYFMSEDNLSAFISAELINIKITDTELKEGLMEKHNITESSLYEGGIMFVDLETSVGVLQFAAYNEHNGYYGHTAKVISKQLTEEMVL